MECFTSVDGKNSICPSATTKFNKNCKFEDNYRKCHNRFCWANPPFVIEDMKRYVKIMWSLVRVVKGTVFLVVVPQFIADDKEMQELLGKAEI